MCGYGISNHLGKHQVVWLLNCILRLSRVCKKLQCYLPKWLRHYDFPPAMSKSSCSFTFSPVIDIFKSLNSSHPNRCEIFSHCFSQHFPSDKDVGHLSNTYMLTCHLFIINGKLFAEIFGHIFNWSFCLLLLSFERSLHAPDRSPLPDMWFTKIFSKCFSQSKFRMKSHFSNFSFIGTFSALSKNWSQYWRPLKYNPFWVNYFEKCKVQFFACGCPSVLPSFIEKIQLSLLCLCQQLVDCICVDLQGLSEKEIQL